MTTFLPFFVVIMLLVVGLGYFNEKVTKITEEIALMLYAIIVGAILLLISHFIKNEDIQLILHDIQLFDLEDYLMDCVLCFMLFSGSCHMKIRDFKRMARQVSVLSFLCTFLGALIYGFAFYGFALLLKLDVTLPVCLMFGSIVAPTDVALFVCFSGIVKAAKGENAIVIMLREVLGAAAIGFGVSFICIYVFARTLDYNRQIFASLLAVATAYLLCEKFDCSGAIASVVCGVMFSTIRRYEKGKGQFEAMQHFDTFWDILDNLLNSVLYVMLGLSFVPIIQMPHVRGLVLIAILCNWIGRAGSVALSTPAMGNLPDNYNWKNFTMLLTWGGLRGGLCIALAMSTKPMLASHTYQLILGGTYAIVFFTTVIQGLTMSKVYGWISKRVGK